MAWQVGTAANAMIAVAYLAIAWAIARTVAKNGQLRRNPLGAATAAILFTCAVQHVGHVVHLLLPAFGGGGASSAAWRQAYDVPTALWDVLAAVVGVYYWSLRRTYGSFMHGAKLLADMHQRERQALELNDAVLQGMVVAKLALELDEVERARAALESSIDSASKIITDLLGPATADERDKLLRHGPATLGADTASPATARETP